MSAFTLVRKSSRELGFRASVRASCSRTTCVTWGHPKLSSGPEFWAPTQNNPPPWPRFPCSHPTHLVEVFLSGPHLLPGLIQQLDAHTEELMEALVLAKEHGRKVLGSFGAWSGGAGGAQGESVYSPWPSLPFRPPFLDTLCPVPLTGLPDMEQFTQQHSQLDAAPGKGTLVLVLTAAVLQHKLGWWEHRTGWGVTTEAVETPCLGGNLPYPTPPCH